MYRLKFVYLEKHDIVVKDTSFCEWSDNYNTIIIVNNFRNEYLEASFSKCDFSFRGNRLYKNYLLEFNNIIFIVASTTEVVLNKQKDRNQLLTNIGDFQKMLASEVLTFKLNQLKSPRNQSEEKLALYLSEIKRDDNGNIIWNKKVQKKAKMKI